MSNFIVVYFKSDNSFSIIEDINNKFKNSDNVKVLFDDKWCIGEKVFMGSKKKCQSFADFEFRKAKFVPTDDSDVEIEQFSETSKRFSSK